MFAIPLKFMAHNYCRWQWLKCAWLATMIPTFVTSDSIIIIIYSHTYFSHTFSHLMLINLVVQSHGFVTIPYYLSPCFLGFSISYDEWDYLLPVLHVTTVLWNRKRWRNTSCQTWVKENNLTKHKISYSKKTVSFNFPKDYL